MKTELEILEERINKLREKQELCDHEWAETKYDPERKEIMRDEFVDLGSDSYHTEVGTGFYEDVDRWSRICKKCGKKEYAYEMEEVPVKIVRRPRFINE